MYSWDHNLRPTYQLDKLVGLPVRRRLILHILRVTSPRKVVNLGNMALVGQGFVDDAFRVWNLHHLGKSVQAKNAGPNVQSMIDHVKRERQRS